MAPAKNKMQAFLSRLTPSSSTASVPRPSKGSDFHTAEEGHLFSKVDPAVDGEDCDHDCASCSIHYPAKFKIEESDKLYGHVKGWSTHLLVATGKTDWLRDVEDEKGSVMEAVGKAKGPRNGRLMLSASNMPTPDDYGDHPPGQQPTTVLLLPAFQFLHKITPADVPELITSVINSAPTTTSQLGHNHEHLQGSSSLSDSLSNGHGELADQGEKQKEDHHDAPAAASKLPQSVTSQFDTRPCNHRAVILLCSHRTRDARCGQSAPLLRREFERHLRPLGLHRDLYDERPGGVGIYFINHVGGHKYSANMMVYRRRQNEDGSWGEGTQGIWLARVRPEECEQIVKFTVLQGKLVKPETQLRGGFDRERGLVSW